MTNDDNDAGVLRIVTKAAKIGVPCPSNKAIGRAIYASDYVASRALRRLELVGKLRVVVGTNKGRRKVVVHNVGETDWTACEKGGNTKLTNVDRDGMERITDETDPWVGCCFAEHNLVIRA